MFNTHSFDNSKLGGAAFMEVVQDRSEEAEPGDRARLQPIYMPLISTVLAGVVTGPVARLSIEHLFGHGSDEEGPVLETVYRFPLPGDAAVTGVRVTFGEIEILAELADRHEAEAEYDEARATGRQAVLLSRESPDVFSLHVSGIEPEHQVRVITEYVQSVRSTRTGFSLRVPLTAAPRYTSDDGRYGRHEHGQPLALTLDPGHRFSLDLTVKGATSLHSPTHALHIDNDSDGQRVTLEDGEVMPDRDLLLEWKLPRQVTSPTLSVTTWRDDDPARNGSHEYFLATVTPPARTDEIERPREVILLVDRSGSMSGAKSQAANWAVHRFLSGLKPYDAFSIGLFHSTTHWFANESIAATESNVSAARRFVDGHRDSGATELERALDEALRCGRSRGSRARHVVIITDAQVTNSARILELARDEARRDDRRRISVLCIDAAPNSHLVHELVAVGGGLANFLTSDPDEDDITTALDDLMDFWGEPVEIGLSMSINRPDVWVMGRPVADEEMPSGDASRIDLGDLPTGLPIWIVGRAPAGDKAFCGELQRQDGEVITSVNGAEKGDVAIRSLFGAKRLLALEYQLESMVPFRRHRRSEDPARERLRDLLVSESLSYGLVSSETSFVAVRQEAGQLVQRGAIVPNALPSGWDEPFAAYSYAPGAFDGVVARMSEPGVFEAAPPPNSRMSPRRERRESVLPQSRGGTRTLFSGVPSPANGETVLCEIERFGETGRLVSLSISVDGEDDGLFDGELELYVGGDAQPRARVHLRDILNQGGRRPLNVRVLPHFDLRLILRHVRNGSHAPSMTITLEWQ